MKKPLLAIALSLSAPSFADDVIQLPSGETCMINRAGHVYGCTGQRPARPSETYRASPPSGCAQLERRIAEINDNLRAGARGGEFERQKQLRRQYESQYRANCR